MPLWIGPNKGRYRIQQGISLVVMILAAAALVEGMAGGATLEELKKPLVGLVIGGVMLYFANKW